MITRLLILLASYTTALPYDNVQGPEYGDEWIYFYDDAGNTHTMNFSTLPQETRGMIFGDAYFYLYTRRNTDAEQLDIPEDSQIFTSQYFNSSNEIKVVTHGWFSHEKTEWLQEIKDAFLRKSDFNIITVDWSELAKNPAYPWSAFSTRYVGKKTAKLLDAIARTYQLDGKVMHLMGHSLGSHVMGYTALFSNQRIRRITVAKRAYNSIPTGFPSEVRKTTTTLPKFKNGTISSVKSRETSQNAYINSTDRFKQNLLFNNSQAQSAYWQMK